MIEYNIDYRYSKFFRREEDGMPDTLYNQDVLAYRKERLKEFIKESPYLPLIGILNWMGFKVDPEAVVSNGFSHLAIVNPYFGFGKWDDVFDIDDFVNYRKIHVYIDSPQESPFWLLSFETYILTIKNLQDIGDSDIEQIFSGVL